MTKQKTLSEKLLAGDSTGPTPTERYDAAQANRAARRAAQSEALKIERKKKQDAPEVKRPLWERLMESVGAKPSTGSFRQRLLDTVEGRR